MPTSLQDRIFEHIPIEHRSPEYISTVYLTSSSGFAAIYPTYESDPMFLSVHSTVETEDPFDTPIVLFELSATPVLLDSSALLVLRTNKFLATKVFNEYMQSPSGAHINIDRYDMGNNGSITQFTINNNGVLNGPPTYPDVPLEYLRKSVSPDLFEFTPENPSIYSKEQQAELISKLFSQSDSVSPTGLRVTKYSSTDHTRSYKAEFTLFGNKHYIGDKGLISTKVNNRIPTITVAADGSDPISSVILTCLSNSIIGPAIIGDSIFIFNTKDVHYLFNIKPARYSSGFESSLSILYYTSRYHSTAYTLAIEDTGVLKSYANDIHMFNRNTGIQPGATVFGHSQLKRMSINQYLTSQINTRYAMKARPASGLANIVVDTYFPLSLIANRFNMSEFNNYRLPSTATAISPFIARAFGVKQIPIADLCTVLGYTRKHLVELVTAVRKQQYTMTFIGYGGTNTNTIHWLNSIMQYTDSANLFKSVNIFEYDNIEFSNLLRFPIDPTSVLTSTIRNDINKLDLLGNQLSRLSNNVPSINKQRLRTNGYIQNVFKSIDDNTTVPLTDKHIVYGAPGLATREELSNIGGFISATHGDSSCSLYLNPSHNLTLQVESYGVIELNTFFMNQLRLAIGLLETLANPDFDPQARDLNLLSYEFDGNPVLPTARKYNFQISQSSNVIHTDTDINNMEAL